MSHRVALTLCVLALVSIAGMASASGGSQGGPAAPAPDGTIVATGMASSPVDARPRDGEFAIRRAVAAAASAAIPAAVQAARQRAQVIATAAGLRVGPARAVTDQVGGSFWQTMPGTFGTDRYCGVVGRRGKPKRRTCRVPEDASAVVTVTFAVG